MRRSNTSLRGRFGIGKFQAKRRGLSWLLTLEEFSGLQGLPCHYCGLPYTVVQGAGLDRVDSDRGYERDNVVPCCWECNQAKHDNFHHDEMMIIGQAIRQVKQQRAMMALAMDLAGVDHAGA